MDHNYPKTFNNSVELKRKKTNNYSAVNNSTKPVTTFQNVYLRSTQTQEENNIETIAIEDFDDDEPFDFDEEQWSSIDEVTVYECFFCFVSFLDLNGYRAHMNEHYDNKDTIKVPTLTQKQEREKRKHFECFFCSLKMTSIAAYKTHMDGHYRKIKTTVIVTPKSIAATKIPLPIVEPSPIIARPLKQPTIIQTSMVKQPSKNVIIAKPAMTQTATVIQTMQARNPSLVIKSIIPQPIIQQQSIIPKPRFKHKNPNLNQPPPLILFHTQTVVQDTSNTIDLLDTNNTNKKIRKKMVPRPPKPPKPPCPPKSPATLIERKKENERIYEEFTILPYRCDICQARLPCISIVKDHMRKHKRNVCVYCKERFITKADLLLHMKVHTDIEQQQPQSQQPQQQKRKVIKVPSKAKNFVQMVEPPVRQRLKNEVIVLDDDDYEVILS